MKPKFLYNDEKSEYSKIIYFFKKIIDKYTGFEIYVFLIWEVHSMLIEIEYK